MFQFLYKTERRYKIIVVTSSLICALSISHYVLSNYFSLSELPCPPESLLSQAEILELKKIQGTIDKLDKVHQDLAKSLAAEPSQYFIVEGLPKKENDVGKSFHQAPPILGSRVWVGDDSPLIVSTTPPEPAPTKKVTTKTKKSVSPPLVKIKHQQKNPEIDNQIRNLSNAITQVRSDIQKLLIVIIEKLNKPVPTDDRLSYLAQLFANLITILGAPCGALAIITYLCHRLSSKSATS